MSDDARSAATPPAPDDGQPTADQAAVNESAAAAPASADAQASPAAAPPPPAEPPPAAASPADSFAALFPPDRPEYAVGAAFAGGFVLALLLKRLAR